MRQKGGEVEAERRGGRDRDIKVEIE